MRHVVYEDQSISLRLQTRNIENNVKYNGVLLYNLP